MERRINPLPILVGLEPEADHGDFLDGFVATREHIFNAKATHEPTKTNIKQDSKPKVTSKPEIEA